MRILEKRIFYWRLAGITGQRVLSRADEIVHLEPKMAEVLVYLAAHAGKAYCIFLERQRLYQGRTREDDQLEEQAYQKRSNSIPPMVAPTPLAMN